MVELPASRRRLLLGAVGLFPGTVAGCLGEDSAGSGGDDTPTPDLDHHRGDGHMPVPDGKICDSVCGMGASSPPDWVAQLAHEDGLGAFFCSVGCMVAYNADPEWSEGSEASVIGVWVTDYDSRAIIDGLDATYVLAQNEVPETGPMGTNPLPFEDRDVATAFVEEIDGLSADEDVVTFDDFDLDIARTYRGNRLP